METGWMLGVITDGMASGVAPVHPGRWEHGFTASISGRNLQCQVLYTPGHTL